MSTGCLAVMVSACATQATKAPAAEAPVAFENAVPANASWPTKEWYRGFASDELISLMSLAEQNNVDLAAAQARIRQADARARAAGAAILPQINAGANITHTVGHTNDPSVSPQTDHETDWSAMLSASYEVDFWGKNRAVNNSAKLLVTASKADRDTLALTTSSGVANAYFQVLSLRERLTIAQENLDSARTVLQVIEARYKAGMASAVELATQRAAVANAELLLPQLQQQEVEARGALALLVGHNPENFTVTGSELNAIAEPVVAPGLPAELLIRRPDVLTAEANLKSANADVAAARAALFPTLTLTASGGIQNPFFQAAVTTLGSTGSSLTLGASLVQTIFDGGRRRAVRDEVQAREDELIVSYRGAILAALLDVENSLAAIHHLDVQQQAQSENLMQSERAFEGAQLRFRAGSGDYLTVLESQRTLSAAREQMSQYKLARLQAIVSLCKALGGGWQQPGSAVQSQQASSPQS